MSPAWISVPYPVVRAGAGFSTGFAIVPAVTGPGYIAARRFGPLHEDVAITSWKPAPAVVTRPVDTEKPSPSFLTPVVIENDADDPALDLGGVRAVQCRGAATQGGGRVRRPLNG